MPLNAKGRHSAVGFDTSIKQQSHSLKKVDSYNRPPCVVYMKFRVQVKLEKIVVKKEVAIMKIGGGLL